MHWEVEPDPQSQDYTSSRLPATDWICFPKMLRWNLIPNVIVFEGGVSGRWTGHEGGDLKNEIRAPIKETPDCSLTPSVMWGNSKRIALCEPEREFLPKTESTNALISDFPTSSTEEYMFVDYKPPPSILHFQYSVTAVKMDQDSPFPRIGPVIIKVHRNWTRPCVNSTGSRRQCHWSSQYSTPPIFILLNTEPRTIIALSFI